MMQHCSVGTDKIGNLNLLTTLDDINAMFLSGDYRVIQTCKSKQKTLEAYRSYLYSKNKIKKIKLINICIHMVLDVPTI